MSRSRRGELPLGIGIILLGFLAAGVSAAEAPPPEAWRAWLSVANHMCDQYYGNFARAGGGLFVLEDPFGS